MQGIRRQRVNAPLTHERRDYKYLEDDYPEFIYTLSYIPEESRLSIESHHIKEEYWDRYGSNYFPPEAVDISGRQLRGSRVGNTLYEANRYNHLHENQLQRRKAKVLERVKGTNEVRTRTIDVILPWEKVSKQERRLKERIPEDDILNLRPFDLESFYSSGPKTGREEQRTGSMYTFDMNNYITKLSETTKWFQNARPIQLPQMGNLTDDSHVLNIRPFLSKSPQSAKQSDNPDFESMTAHEMHQYFERKVKENPYWQQEIERVNRDRISNPGAYDNSPSDEYIHGAQFWENPETEVYDTSSEIEKDEEQK